MGVAARMQGERVRIWCKGKREEMSEKMVLARKGTKHSKGSFFWSQALQEIIPGYKLPLR